MKGLVGIFLIPVALAMVVFAASNRDVSRAQQNFDPQAQPQVDDQTAARPFVWQCYDLQKGDDPQAIVRLVTENFGGDRVRVRTLVMMCELAYKVRSVPGVPSPNDPVWLPADTTRILACYRLEDGTDPNDPYILDTDNFAPDGVIVRTSSLMCEEASKTRVITGPGGISVTEVVGTPTGQTWQCYKLSHGDDPKLGFRLITKNFGRDDVRVRTGVLMCETSAKFKLVADNGGNLVPMQFGEATGEVLECYRLDEGGDPNVQVTLETLNFGRDDVVVRKSNLMCEDAEKEPVYIAGVAFPDDEP